MQKPLSIVKYILALILILSFFLIYENQDRFRQSFKSNMETSFSKLTLSDVTIEGLSGNPFRKIFFKNLSFNFEKYSFVFESASLEYSLFDIISGKTPKTGITETVMSLYGGSLVLKNNVIMSNQINGKIRLRPDTVILENIDFELLGQIYNRVDGQISTWGGDYRVEFSYEATPLFKEQEFVFEKIKALLIGPLENLTLRGKVERKGLQDMHFRAYSINSEGLINIGSRIGVETDQANINHLLSVDAEIDPEKKIFKAVFLPNSGRISAEGNYSSLGEIDVEFKNHQLKILGQDFSNVLNLNAKTVFQNNFLSYLLVDISTGASVVNHRPVNEIEASLRIDNERIRAIYIKIGDTALLSGFFDIKPPRKLDVNLNFTNFILQEILDVFIENRPDISGRVSGSVYMRGLFSEPKIDIKSTIYDGHFGNINYDRIIVNADGIWPYLRIYDSRIMHKSSSFMLEGELDMRKLGSEKLMEDIIVTASDNTIIWEGWDITRIDQGREFLLQKALGSGFRVGYRARMSDETKYEPATRTNELHLEYDFLDDDSVLELRAKEKEEFLGIRKKYRF
jgi:hypothetical protein